MLAIRNSLHLYGNALTILRVGGNNSNGNQARVGVHTRTHTHVCIRYFLYLI
jgi:hypothetical protein